MQLNKYLALAGIASRRYAIDLIKKGLVTINGKEETNPAYRVKETDEVHFNQKLVKPAQKLYIILNKPKGYVTTREDELGRKTVMDLLKEIPTRVNPIGRLDKDTTGVLLFTNDGDLHQKLTHPKFNIKKTYVVTLNKQLDTSIVDEIKNGIFLEDGFIKPDSLIFKNNNITITLHSGKKRIVRRIFEHFNYKIKTLDRINFAGITYKMLPRGTWRILTPLEIRKLKKI